MNYIFYKLKFYDQNFSIYFIKLNYQSLKYYDEKFDFFFKLN